MQFNLDEVRFSRHFFTTPFTINANFKLASLANIKTLSIYANDAVLTMLPVTCFENWVILSALINNTLSNDVERVVLT